jgi:zinc transport system substrate-binding protein
MLKFIILMLGIGINLTMFSVPSLFELAFASDNSSEISEGTNNTITSLQEIPKPSFPGSDQVKVVASFYPIFEFVEKIGGNRIDTTSLIPVGIEPHDFEPTVQQIQNAETADMVVYNGAGLEEPWIRDINSRFFVDASEGLNLTKGDHETHDEENSTAIEGTQALDPHVWLDPFLVKHQVNKIKDALIKVDPNYAPFYNENARKFISELDNLDSAIRSKLANCEMKDFIAFHNAFSYFADRYGLTQHSIHEATSPEGEILPQRIRQIISLAQDTGLDTIYSEELVDPRLANVIAQEIPNGKVLVLSPVEGISKEEQNAGIGYIDKMNENIENLRLGLKCK